MNILTRGEISRTALNLKSAYLGLLVAANLATVPGQPLMAAWRSVWPHIPDPSLTLSASGDKESYRIQAVFEEISRWGFKAMDAHVMTAAQMATSVALGDLVTESAHYDSTDPLHQFVRHYRNGCAHGDNWDIRPGKLKVPAHFADITLAYSLNGKRTTDTVLPLRHVQLLQAVADHFGPPAAQDQTETWKYYPNS